MGCPFLCVHEVKRRAMVSGKDHLYMLGHGKKF